MIAIPLGASVIWCHMPRQIAVYVSQIYNATGPKILPDHLLSNEEMVEYNELQSQNIEGRYLEK